MPYPHEKKLRQKAADFIQQIGDKLDIDVAINETSLEEYSVAIQFAESGFAKIYYSPKRDYYTLTTLKLNKAVKEKVTQVWDNWAVAEAKPFVLKEAQALYQAFVDGSFDSQKKNCGLRCCHPQSRGGSHPTFRGG